jgi:hypothetical protein
MGAASKVITGIATTEPCHPPHDIVSATYLRNKVCDVLKLGSEITGETRFGQQVRLKECFAHGTAAIPWTTCLRMSAARLLMNDSPLAQSTPFLMPTNKSHQAKKMQILKS